MSMNHQARIEVEPAHVGYPAWWVVPVSYQALPALAAVIDIVWIVSLSAATGYAYHTIALNAVFDIAQSIGAGIAVAALFSTTAQARGAYGLSNLLRVRSQIAAAWMIWLTTFLCLATVAFTLKISDTFSRGAVLLFFFSGFTAIAGVRFGSVLLLRRIVSSGLLNSRRAVLVTDSSRTTHQELARPLERYGCALARVFVISAPDRGGINDPALAEQLTHALRYIRQRRPDEIILAIPWRRAALIRRISHELRSLPTPVRLLADPDVDWLLNRPLLDLGPAKAVELQRAPLTVAQRAAKRTLDLALASTGLLALFPVLLLLALAIRLDSTGPVLFRQGRVGFNGRAFRIYKFRTMTCMEDGSTVRQASRDDLRVTRVGRWLRRFSLDELPQLLNVLKGEMSLVGPRPHALAHDDEYSQLIREYASRQKMKPGITGWAQVNGCRGETPHVDMMRRRVNHDLWYIDYWSIWLDVRILAMTIIHVLRTRSAY